MKCVISPVRALPVAPVKLANPAVTIGSARIDFPVTLESGQYVEFDSMSACRWYSETGKLLGAITPSGTAPKLAAGDNTVTFSSPQQDGHTVRAEVTVIAAGTPIRR